MKISPIIFALFTLTSIGPLLGAVTLHRGDLPSLILSASTTETIKCFQDCQPDIAYVGYEVIDPSHSLRAFFTVSNPYEMDVSITRICMGCYCHEHGTFFGSVSGEALPVEVPAKGTRTLSLLLCFTDEGKNDVLDHYASGNELYLDLKDIDIVIQGVEVNCPSDVTMIGPVPLTEGFN
jgi:hypothetical protein